jgi:non-reducing end alpha-L-arabinofuranosidase
MEAVYFGNSKDWGYGNGAGPWVMADVSGWALTLSRTIMFRPLSC